MRLGLALLYECAEHAPKQPRNVILISIDPLRPDLPAGKLIPNRQTGEKSLFDLREDPGEQEEVGPQSPEVTAFLSRELENGAKLPILRALRRFSRYFLGYEVQGV